MGRLIDADKVDDAIYKCFEGVQCYDGTGYDIYSDSKEDIDKIPTVEAIPKAEYEARLKADMVAMLAEIQTEIEELDTYDVERTHGLIENAYISKEVDNIIQQKINLLKAVSESQESEDKEE